MLNRISLATIVALFVGAFAASTATAAPPTDFWQNKNFMNMAHQGGETEAPGNTLFAFKTAIADRGADTLEMDGYLTEDREFVITHDMEPHKTSNAPFSNFGSNPQVGVENFIMNQTLAELKLLDFGYKFRPRTGHYGFPHGDAPAEEYIYRGIATGDKQPPAGYTANDFRIPTLEEVLIAFPDTPLNVDMKAPGSAPEMATEAARVVAEIMSRYPERSDDVIIASFFQGAMEKFHELLPSHRALSVSQAELIGYAGGDPITPAPVALQPPDQFSLPPVVETVQLLKPKAEADGYAIHVWPANGSPDAPATWQKVMDQGADGFFTDKPGALHEYLCETGVPRPDGSPRCAEQICPEGQTGIAPDNCVDIPACPEGEAGTPPACEPVVIQETPKSKVKKLAFVKVKGKTRAGKQRKLILKVTATKGKSATVKVKLKSSSRQVKVKKLVMVRLKPGATVKKVITLKSRKKAKGKVRITASSGAAQSSVNPLYTGSGAGGQNPLHTGRD